MHSRGSANSVVHPGRMPTCAYAGRSRQVYNHYPYLYYRTGVLVNRLIELVFARTSLSGLWRFCGFFKKHLTELVFDKAYWVELVFHVRSSRRAQAHTQLFPRNGTYARIREIFLKPETFLKNFLKRKNRTGVWLAAKTELVFDYKYKKRARRVYGELS